MWPARQKVEPSSRRASGRLQAALQAYNATVPSYAPPVTTSALTPAPLISPPAPGFAPGYQTPRGAQAYNLAQAVEALFGRISTRLGPTNPRWSTFAGELDPETITKAIDTANTGQPYQLHDMYRRAIENDAHLGGIVEQRIAGIVCKPDRLDPPEGLSRDFLAVSVANWLRAARDQVDDFDDARFALLWADGAAYSSAEIVYAHRKITWFTADNQRVTGIYCLPAKLETVDGRAFRFDTATDEPLLWLQGDYIPLPPGKFIFHRAYGHTALTERRGFMRSCIYLHAMKQWDLRDMAEYLDKYGLPQMVGEYDANKYNYEEAREIARKVLDNFGQLGFPLAPMGAFQLSTDTPPPQWALVHRDAAEFLNGEMTKRVTLGPLVMDQGSGYGLGDVHAEGAVDGRILAGNKLCTSMRQRLWRPTLELNAVQLAQQLGHEPSAIRSVLSAYRCRIQRDDSPEQRQKIFSQAMRDGCSVSRTQYRADLHIDEPKDASDALGGEAVSIPSSGAVTSAVDASKGAVAPTPGPGTAAPPTGKPAALPDASATMERNSVVQAAVDRLDPGVMIALYPPPAVAAKLALQRTEPEELHITLAYLGRRSQVDVRQVAQALQGAALGSSLSGQLGGIGVFPPSESSEGRAVIWVPVDVPGLAELRQAVVAAVAGIAPPKAAHGWTPHLTLAYVEPGTPPPPPVAPVAVAFNEIWLVCGEQRQCFPLETT